MDYLSNMPKLAHGIIVEVMGVCMVDKDSRPMQIGFFSVSQEREASKACIISFAVNDALMSGV